MIGSKWIIQREFEGRAFYFYEPTHLGWINDPEKAIHFSSMIDAGRIVVWLRTNGRKCKAIEAP